MLPFVEDPDNEIEEVKEQAEENLKRQQELFAGNANTPPDDEVDLDGEDEDGEDGESPESRINTKAEGQSEDKKKE